MNSAMWRTLCDEIPLEATPHELDAALRDAEDDDLTEDERAALWLYVWSRGGRGGRTAARLRADARPSASPAMIRYLAVLIRASFTSSPAPDVADLRELRRSTTGRDDD
jgi:hypothetical protein